MPFVKSLRIGARGEFLLALAVLDIAQFYRLTWPSKETLASATTQFLANVLPLPVWGVIWGLVGALCLAQAFMRTDRYAFAAASGLKVGWALVHVAGWVWGVPQVWWSAAIWLVFARVVHVIAKVPGLARPSFPRRFYCSRWCSLNTMLVLLPEAPAWSPDNTVAIVAAVVALIGTAVAGTVAGRASVKANRVTAQSNERIVQQQAAAERARVESEAFQRAKEIYDHAITELREELDRIRTQYERTQEQLDKISEKLLSERTASQEIKGQLHRAQREMGEMNSRIEYMERVITNLRQQLLAAGLTPEEHIIHRGSSP